MKNILLFIFLLLGAINGCKFTCNLSVERICLDNIYGLIAPDCFGFIDCLNITTPCSGECMPEYPVLSKDGLSCSKCQEDGKTCPLCEEGELWCREEEACKPRTAACGGQCSSLLYPVLNKTAQACSPCSPTQRWCGEDGRCFDLQSEPCNGTCWSLGSRYCPESDTCQEEGYPCGSRPAGEKQVKIDSTSEGPKPRTLLPNTKSVKSASISNDLCNSPLDAIVRTYDGSSYVFQGPHYWLLVNSTTAQGYPRLISQDWPGLPASIDAAVTWKTNKNTYFFKGSEYWKFTDKTPSPGYPKNISKWHEMPSDLDAAFEWVEDKYLYFFKGSQYWKYNKSLQTMNIGYPREIQDGWGDIPTGVDAAFLWDNGQIYFFKSGKYWRFNAGTGETDKSEQTFPRDVSKWWFGCEEKTIVK